MSAGLYKDLARLYKPPFSCCIVVNIAALLGQSRKRLKEGLCAVETRESILQTINADV